MEGISGIIIFLVLVGVSIASAIDKQKKSAHGSSQPARRPGMRSLTAEPLSRDDESTGQDVVVRQSALAGDGGESVWQDVVRRDSNGEAPDTFSGGETLEGLSSEGASTETAPRRAEMCNITFVNTKVAGNEPVEFDPTKDFDLRRAVIESEILTPKYL